MILISTVFLHFAEAGIIIDFDRENNTYNWITTFDYMIGADNNNIRSYFDGRSNLIKGSLDRWQENAEAGFKSELSIRDGLMFVSSGQYTVNGLDRRRVRTSELAMGLSIKPVSFIELRPLLRADNKRRSELETRHDEKGLGYGVETSIAPAEFRGILINSSLSYDRVNLSNIPRQEGRGHLTASASFFEFDTLSVYLRGLEATTNYYGPGGAADNIIKQIKQERQADMSLSLALPARFRLRIDGDARLSRYLYRQDLTDGSTDGRKDNFGRGGGYEISLGGDLFEAAIISAAYAWATSSDDFQGLELDQDTDSGELSFHGNLRLSGRDTVAADVMLGVTSYTNPNVGASLDDRDQKSIVVNSRYGHRFSRYFSAGLSGGVSSFHQIYVTGARSANNNRNETYVLSPQFEWKPNNSYKLSQSFEIQANYITFDFDRLRIATKNRLFRRATSRTELRIEVSERLTLTQGYLYRYEDYGQLIWDDGWQQAVSWDRKRNGLETRIAYMPVDQLEIEPYFFWEKTGDYHHAVETDTFGEMPAEIRFLRDEQVKMYFQFKTTFRWSQRRTFMADFSHRLRKFMDRPRETNDYIRISMEYMF
jgi:hypothetical protein